MNWRPAGNELVARSIHGGVDGEGGVLESAATTRKTLIGVNLLVEHCFGATQLSRAAIWKNTPRHHCKHAGDVAALRTAPLASGPGLVPNPGQNRGVG
jgi:hypothetical protein